MDRPGSRIHSLDGLRALSVSLVVLGHLAKTTGAPRWLDSTGPYAHFGVRVFFVISGFIITHLLLQEHQQTSAIDLGAFYARRFFRIFPAAYVFMACMTVLLWPTLTAADILSSFAYISNYRSERPWVFGHLWSLAVEEQFYLLWPLALVLWFKMRVRIALATLIAAPLVRALLFALHYKEGAYLWFPSLADALATGCLLAILKPSLEQWLRNWDPFARRWLVLPAVTIALVQFGQTTLLGRATNFVYY